MLVPHSTPITSRLLCWFSFVASDCSVLVFLNILQRGICLFKLIYLKAVEVINSFQREAKLRNRMQQANYSPAKAAHGYKRRRIQGVVPRTACLPITLLSLIPIMSGAGLCSDSVTGMTAGLVLIRNDHRPGCKQTRARTHTLRALAQTDTRTSALHSLVCKARCGLSLLALAVIRGCHLRLRTFVRSKQGKTA